MLAPYVFAVGGAAGALLAGVLFQAGRSYASVVILTAAWFLLSATILTTSSLRISKQSRPNPGRPPTATPSRHTPDQT